MLTSLCINKPQHSSLAASLLSRLKRDKISVRIKESANIRIKEIAYTSRHKSINWKRLDRYVGAQRNHLLCTADVKLPDNIGYRRFKNNELYTRLCTNLALCIIKSLSKQGEVSVGLYDDQAIHTQLCEYILKYTDSLVIKTQALDVYSQTARSVLGDTGAVLRFSKGDTSLSTSSLVIAPDPIQKPICVSENAVVLTTSKPLINQAGRVIYGYNIKLPDRYKKAMPECLDETYFASALYAVGHEYNLGSLVPWLCYDDTGAHTVNSLCKMLVNMQSAS